MAHTGIRLKLEVPAGVILDGDSDWLHMMAVYSEGIPEPDMAAICDGKPPEPKWHKIGDFHAGSIESPPVLTVWVQPVMLPDEYPDDEDSGDDRPAEDPV
jgi:hypothetical protein